MRKAVLALTIWNIISAYPLQDAKANGTECHDLPAKRKVLDEGNALLETNSSLQEKGASPKGYRPDYGYGYGNGFSQSILVDAPKTIEEVKSLKLDTTAQITSKLRVAQYLEEIDQIELAKLLYERLLAKSKEMKIDNRTQASLFEGIGRATLFAPTNREVVSQQLKRYVPRYLRWENEHFRFFADRISQSTYAVVDTISKIALSETEWKSAKSSFEIALALRTQSGPKNLLVSDLQILGTICERLHDTQNAFQYLVRANALNEETTTTNLVNSLQKNSSIAYEIETHIDKFFHPTFEAESSVLLSTCIEKSLTETHPERAIELFRLYCIDPKGPRLNVTPAVLPALTQIMPNDDDLTFQMYLTQRANEIALSDTDFVALMQELVKRNWNNCADIVCTTVIANASPQSLLSVANWFSRLRDRTKFRDCAKRILGATRYESDELSVEHLTSLRSLIATFPNGDAELTNIEQDTDTAIKIDEDQLRRKKCLGMAAELNATGLRLEKRGQLKMASKLYGEALDIQKVNLKSNDPITGNQFVELARVAAQEKRYDAAAQLYEKALNILRANSAKDPSDTISALESYGMMLNEWKHEAKASKIYDEARELFRKRETKGGF